MDGLTNRADILQPRSGLPNNAILVNKADMADKK